jgi:hypothetical protein
LIRYQETRRKKTRMTDNTQTKPYAVVMVFSSWKLQDLINFFEKELKADQDQIGLMHIDRVKDRNNGKWKETNRTIMLVSRQLYEDAEKAGLTSDNRDLDFKMTEYHVREHNFPKEGYSKNFFVQLPENISDTDALDQLENKVSILCKFGLFTEENKPRVKIPLKSRETGAHQNKAFITFSRATPLPDIALARVLLNQTRLYLTDDGEKYELMECYWAKERPKKGSKVTHKRPFKKGPRKSPKKEGVDAGEKEVKKEPTKSFKPIQVKALPPGQNMWSTPLPTEAAATPSENLETTTPSETPTPLETPTPTEEPENTLKPFDFPPLN